MGGIEIFEGTKFRVNKSRCASKAKELVQIVFASEAGFGDSIHAKKCAVMIRHN